MVAHLTCSILPRNALMPASLYIKPMTSCPKVSNNTPEMLVAAILNVRLAAVSHFDVFDVPVNLSLAGGVRSQLCHCAEHAACGGYDCRSGCSSVGVATRNGRS